MFGYRKKIRSIGKNFLNSWDSDKIALLVILPFGQFQVCFSQYLRDFNGVDVDFERKEKFPG